MMKKGASILVVDDDKGILNLLRNSLEQNNYMVYTAESGEEAVEQFAQHYIDLVLLDLKLPGISGLEACKQMRKQKQAHIPVIILSVKDAESDKVEALSTCADDYVSKPFSTPEVLARITAHLRRNRPTGPIFTAGSLSVDFSQHQVQIDGREIDLTPIEYQILTVLIENRGRIVTPKMFISKVWNDEYGITEHNIYVYIHSLRKKIEPDMTNPRFILAVPRVGYRFKADN
jgi:two-component system KDP operon response regulator KdpE